MKFLVIGATGPTGQCLVKEALDRGHQVTALVRNPDKLTTQHENLKVIKGDITSDSDLKEHIQGCDALLSAVGGTAGFFTPCDIYSLTGEAISRVMKETGVNRYVLVTSIGTKDHPDCPFIWRWVLRPAVLKNVVDNMGVLEDFLTSPECAHINYTVVKPPRLTNKPSSGLKPKAAEGQAVTDAINEISRADVAKFMLDVLDTNEWDRKLVALGTSKPSEQDVQGSQQGQDDSEGHSVDK